MFSQMCDAVSSCHEQGVFHRDIKPENFIVTDGVVNGERRVIVKLTDFGLSTTEAECSDMDCGSAPYMSFECRNNCAPTYRPAPADVWSLGIVLINMYVLLIFTPDTHPSFLIQVVSLQSLDGYCSRSLLFLQPFPSVWSQLLHAAFHRHDFCRGRFSCYTRFLPSPFCFILSLRDLFDACHRTRVWDLDKRYAHVVVRIHAAQSPSHRPQTRRLHIFDNTWASFVVMPTLTPSFVSCRWPNASHPLPQFIPSSFIRSCI